MHRCFALPSSHLERFGIKGYVQSVNRSGDALPSYIKTITADCDEVPWEVEFVNLH